jgi:hypothetical protein
MGYFYLSRVPQVTLEVQIEDLGCNTGTVEVGEDLGFHLIPVSST